MRDVKQKIIGDLKKIVKGLTGQDVAPILEHPKDERHGDYSTNIAMAIFASAKLNPSTPLRAGVQSSKFWTPMDLANKIASSCQRLASSYIEKVEAVAPGFINFWLSKDYLASEMIDIVKSKDSYGKSKKLNSKKIMVEFTDPNPFKEFHIGHLYSNIVGESISRLLEDLGADVMRVCYQGDVGLHVAKALYGIMKHESRIKNIEDKGPEERVKFLGEAYAYGTKAYEKDENAKKEIEKINKEVYEESPSIMEIYKKGREWSLEYFDSIYKRLGTKFKRFYFESEAGKIGIEIARKYIGKVFKKSNGAVIFPGEKYGLHNRVFINSLGLPTYEAKELGLAPTKYKDFKYDESIIVTGNEIVEYFKVILKALEQIYPDLARKTQHVVHGMVRLPKGKMSSRTGEVVTGEWLLDEAKKRIRDRYKEIGERVAEQVAVGAVKYGLLKHGIGKDITFDFDESISLEGNSGPYLQYSFARTQSVLAKLKTQNSKLKIATQNSKLKFSLAGSHLAKLKAEETSLLRTLYRFPEIIEEAAGNFAPNLLCNYLFDLAQKFNLFYQKVPIIKQAKSLGANVRHPEGVIETREFRLGLTMVVGQVIKNGLYLLGIHAPERM